MRSDFYDYFKPIQEAMPNNCSSGALKVTGFTIVSALKLTIDVAAVIAHFDSIANDTTAFNALKAQFGLSQVTAPADVTGARE